VQTLADMYFKAGILDHRITVKNAFVSSK
jgi:hypothetical protein